MAYDFSMQQINRIASLFVVWRMATYYFENVVAVSSTIGLTITYIFCCKRFSASDDAEIL
jgi:hypothetical protein